MTDIPESISGKVIGEYIEDDKVLCLTLAVMYWGMVGQNPKTTPAQEGKIFSTADKFYDWLMK